MEKERRREGRQRRKIDPKDLMAVERATTSLVGVAISLIILGFVVEKFELFLHLAGAEIADRGRPVRIPQLQEIGFYNHLGIGIVAGGILLALYTYRYYTNWVAHLERGEIDTDKRIYFMLALFVAGIGAVLMFSMFRA